MIEEADYCNLSFKTSKDGSRGEDQYQQAENKII